MDTLYKSHRHDLMNQVKARLVLTKSTVPDFEDFRQRILAMSETQPLTSSHRWENSYPQYNALLQFLSSPGP